MLMKRNSFELALNISDIGAMLLTGFKFRDEWKYTW